MILNETQKKWSDIITEEYGVQDKTRLSWMSQYAQIHNVWEAQQGAIPQGIQTDSIYATPLNTMGMGNPLMPSQNQYNVGNVGNGTGIGNDGYDFARQNVGSGDIPMSTLPMAMQVAAMTIGLELVPVIPATNPFPMLSYMDFPYAGGKLGRINETDFDGKGEGADNKPIYIKVNANFSAENLAYIKTLRHGKPSDVANVTVGKLNGIFMGISRIDGGFIFIVKDCTDKATSIAEACEAATKVTIDGKDSETMTAGSIHPELVTSAADHIQGFVNFFDGSDDPMTRAQNETGTGNRIGARMFTKMVQIRAHEVTGSVTRQQLQDMPLYGIDVIGKVLEHMQNEISQGINNRILDRVFRLGVENAVNQYKYQGVNLNLYLAGSGVAATKAVADFDAIKKYGYEGLQEGADLSAQMGVVPNATQNTSAENVHTHQRRIMSRLLAAANLIANVSRRGRGQWAVTNTQVITALQDSANFVIAPMTNTLTQDGSQSLYFAGSVAGINMYVDPYMKWDDTRVCVGRKSNGNDPGVVFMPYILADTVQITAEGTFAPVLLCNSRYAIVDAGFWPEQSYYTFAIDAAEGLII